MKKIIFIILIVLIGLTLLPKKEYSKENTLFWEVQAIDTMKYSRDTSREKLTDGNFDLIIASQTKQIAATGATHIAIATPYDDEFLPILKRWVNAARRNNLHVWFRGNFSGWEKWFGYSQIDRQTHLAKTKEFILNNPELFEDGDIFSSCPECENGGPGDPRRTGDIEGHRIFLQQEYEITKEAFKKINRSVASNYFSMNADIARLIMDKPTTKALDGLVVIDHYVKSPQKLSADATEIAQSSGGKIMLGEFGAPIPDIHGDMTEDEQAAWVHDALRELAKNKNISGLSYWVNVGGSTRLYNDNGTARKVVSVLTSYYNPTFTMFHVINPIGDALPETQVLTMQKNYIISKNGGSIPITQDQQEVFMQADGYQTKKVKIEPGTKTMKVILIPTKESINYKIRNLIKLIFHI